MAAGSYSNVTDRSSIVARGWGDWTAVSQSDFEFAPGGFVSTMDGSTSMLFAVRSDGIVCTTTLDFNTNEYKPWTPVATNYRIDINSRVAVYENIIDRRIEIFATAVDGFVWTAYRTPDGRWSVWDPVSTATRMGPAAPITVDWSEDKLTVELIAASSNGTMMSTSRIRAGPWSDWRPIRPDVSVPPGAFITTIGGRTDDGYRKIYVVDTEGQARVCGWSFSSKSWQYCSPWFSRRMRPGALIAARDDYPSPLLATTSTDGTIWISDKWRQDWTAIPNSRPIQPGAEVNMYVYLQNQFVFGTSSRGWVMHSARTRSDPSSDWLGWWDVMAFNGVPAGAAVNTTRERSSENVAIFIIDNDGRVWRNFFPMY
ncbi:hypothetical protein PWT90_01595 [Aphanocladium album]|nr:hypothetical protein PWT90_01595 [Aphanocladium album]